jgi:hypothetical protein
MKMNAEFVEVGNKFIVIAKATGADLAFPNTLITIEGAGSSAIAKGIVRMLNESQCPECGKFNGLHGEVFHQTQNGDGTGEVRGRYLMCSHAEKS